MSWTDHLVPTDSLIGYAKKLKAAVKQPVTFCENYVPWLEKLHRLADELDFISIHTYPVWEYKDINEGLAYTIENYNAVSAAYPDKQIVVTEVVGLPSQMVEVLSRVMSARVFKSSIFSS